MRGTGSRRHAPTAAVSSQNESSTATTAGCPGSGVSTCTEAVYHIPAR
jgi:hypothetical protein